MKVLFLTTAAFSSSPTYKRAVGTGDELAKSGHEVIIAAMDCKENRLRMDKEASRCKVCWFRKAGMIKEAFEKIRMVWKHRPDVVYSTSYTPRNLAFLRLLLPSKTKMVIEFCELYSQYPYRRFNWKIYETIALCENKYILCASRLLAEHFKNESVRFHLKKHIIYSPYAYPDYLKPVRDGRDNVQTVVYMASLWKGYGVYDVFAACAKLILKLPELQLEVLGGGPEKEALSQLVAERELVKNVHVRGFVPECDLNKFFSSASVFVAPLHDTLQDKARCPSKLFYYLPYNKPIVTCRIGEPFETLGEYGYYYKSDDVDDMSRAIDQALKDSVSFSYPSGFIKNHSWAARAKQFEEFINEA